MAVSHGTISQVEGPLEGIEVSYGVPNCGRARKDKHCPFRSPWGIPTSTCQIEGVTKLPIPCIVWLRQYQSPTLGKRLTMTFQDHQEDLKSEEPLSVHWGEFCRYMHR